MRSLISTEIINVIRQKVNQFSFFALQPSLLQQTWFNPKIPFEHVPSVLQRIRQRHRLQEA